MVCARSLKGQPIEARDGHIGHVEDLYFEDVEWKIRYLVVKTGNWLLGRTVLIAPEAIGGTWHGEAGVPVNLTTEEVRSSPDIDTTQPISRVAEQQLYRHYGWLPYWGTGVAPAPTSDVIAALEQRSEATAVAVQPCGVDPHLCGAEDVWGYNVLATDGEAGQLQDFAIHEEDASVSYLAIHLPKSMLDRTVLIRPSNIACFDWVKRILVSSLSCREVAACPDYEQAAS